MLSLPSYQKEVKSWPQVTSVWLFFSVFLFLPSLLLMIIQLCCCRLNNSGEMNCELKQADSVPPLVHLSYSKVVLK